MNKCYFDPDEGVVVKICATVDIALREVEGARVFQKYVRTSRPRMIDSRSIIMDKVHGDIGSSVAESVIHASVISMFHDIVRAPTSLEIKMSPYSIYQDIQKLRLKYTYSADITSFLRMLEKDIDTRPFVPIHGDLQKQNMFVGKSRELTLIDFEHFCYAPIEFELVNSMFHSDGNCLNIQLLLGELRKSVDISDELIRKALVLYALNRV